MLAKTDTFTIRTPEGIVFSLQLAGPVTRCLAWSLDLAAIAAATSVVQKLIGLLGIVSPDMATAVTIMAYFIISIGYGITLEWFWQGQTLGKKLLRLRVMDGQGLRLQLAQIVIRNLLRFVDSLPVFYLVGGAAVLASRRAQRLGDLAANTLVIRTPALAEPDLEQLLPDKYNSFRAYPHLAARLRQHVTPQEADVALQSLLRRESLAPEARLTLYADLAEYFKQKVQFPEAAQVGLSPEQYLRNVVDILFQDQKKI